MEINVSWEDMRKRSIFLATPMYGGMAHGTYTKSICGLVSQCQAAGIKLQTHFLFNESLITRARSYCVAEFLRSDCTHMLFVDSDITFDPKDVLTLLALADDESPYDIIGAPYPKKTISWEKIKLAVDKGVADEDPSVLANYVGDFVFNPLQGSTITISEPTEVLEIGTGFMLIKRSVFERFDNFYGDTYKFRPDHVRTEHFDGSKEISMYFDCRIDPVTKRYLSEDYNFCQLSRDAGMHVYMCPWMKLEHTGTYTFGGSLQDLANIQANPTADPRQLKKRK